MHPHGEHVRLPRRTSTANSDGSRLPRADPTSTPLTHARNEESTPSNRNTHASGQDAGTENATR